MLDDRQMVRVMEAHNGLTGLIVETTQVDIAGQVREFDAIWVSSLTDSTAKGKPDIELVDTTSRLVTVNDILDVTSKPIVLDGDTGGQVEHFVHLVRTAERLGVSAVIIEDKVGLKKNSLFGTTVAQRQAPPAEFCAKIRAGKQVQLTDDFMIVARIESLILGAGVQDALDRAEAYADAGADALMIHSRANTPAEVFEFVRRYRAKDRKLPIVAVPSTYYDVTEQELQQAGVNIVIYANHLLRSAYPSMVATAKSILSNQSAREAHEHCLSIAEILRLIPGDEE
jgi:phosphoenolpyruvate phosphomutase